MYPALAAARPAGSPLALETGVGPGIGDLLDVFFVRRARFMGAGQIFQTIEFKVEFDFENYNSISFDESYVGAPALPLIDTIRIGQTHVPFGLEAYTSSLFLPMLKRSPLFVGPRRRPVNGLTLPTGKEPQAPSGGAIAVGLSTFTL